MAAANNRDVNLIIRARDEGMRVFEQATKIVEGLLGATNRLGAGAAGTGTRLDALAAAALQFDKAATKIFGAADNAASGMARLGAQLDRRKAELAAIETQASAARMAIQRLSTPEAIAKAGVGGLARWAEQLAGAKAELDRLGGASKTLAADIARLEVVQRGQRKTLQQIGSTATAAAEGRERLKREIEAETAAMRKQARAAEVLRTVERSTGVARDRTDYDQLTAQIREAAAAQDIRIQKLREEEQATAELAREQENQRRITRFLGVTENPNGRQAGLSARVFEQHDEEQLQRMKVALRDTSNELDRMDKEAADLRNRLNPLAQIEANLIEKQKRLNALFRAGKINADELAGGLDHLKREADGAARQLGLSGIDSKGRPSLFGLTPYQLTNFSYQINDIITQLASGSSLTQTMAQQGGQLIQIFPRVGSAVVAGLRNPYILAAAAGVGSIATGLRDVQREAERLRSFEGRLAAMGSGAEYNARALAESARSLDRFGASAEEADAAVTTFVRGGIDPGRIDAFGRAARNMADVLGIEVGEAAGRLTQGFDGTWESLDRLMGESHAWSNEQRRQIRQTMEQQGTQAGLARAFDLLAAKMDEGARRANGPWTEANRSLSASWDNLLEALGDTALIQNAANALDGLAGVVRQLSDLVDGVRSSEEIDLDIRLSEQSIRQAESLLARMRADRGTVFGAIMGTSDSAIAEVERRIAAQRAELAQLRSEQQQGVGGDVQNEETQRRLLEQIAERQRADLEGLDIERQLTEAHRVGNRQLAVRLAGEREYARVMRESRNQVQARAAQIVAERREGNQWDANEDAVIRRFVGRAIQVESGGNPNARPRDRYGRLQSSAVGGGQFLEGTWLAVYRRNFAEQAARMSRQQILDLRRNMEVSRQMTEIFARENAATLRAAGMAVTEANLYALHFLGEGERGGGMRLLRAQRDAPLRSVVAPSAFRSNPWLNNISTAGALQDRFARQFSPDNDAQRGAAEAQAQAQERLNQSLGDSAELREQSIRQARELVGLSGQQLFDAMRRHAVEDAQFAARRQAERDGLTVSEEQLRTIERTVAAEFDLANARERATRAVEELTGEREALLEQLRQAMEIGDGEAIGRVAQRLQDTDRALESAIGTAENYWRSLDSPEARTALANLDTLRARLRLSASEMAEENVQRHRQERDALIEALRVAAEAGNAAEIDRISAQLQNVNRELTTAIENAIRLLGTLNSPEARAAAESLRTTLATLDRDPLNIRRDQLQRPVDDLSNQRDSIMERIQFFEQRGDMHAAEELETRLAAINAQLTQAIDRLDAFWAAVAANPDAMAALGLTAQQIETIRMRLEATRPVAEDLSRQFLMTARQMNEALAQQAVNAVDRFAQAVAEGRKVIGSLWDAFRQFAADFLRQIAQMIIQQIIFNVISGGGNGKGGAGKSIMSVIGGMFHEGGIAGKDGTPRLMRPEWFDNAIRYHSGGIAGLRPGEVPAILKRGEEVLTEADPRHIANGGRGGETAVRNVNIFDASDMLEAALGSRRGERVLVNWVNRNPGLFRLR